MKEKEADAGEGGRSRRVEMTYFLNEFYVCEIVIVGALGYFCEIIEAADVLSIGELVVWCRHPYDLDFQIIPEGLQAPSSQRLDCFHGRVAIVRDENSFDWQCSSIARAETFDATECPAFVIIHIKQIGLICNTIPVKKFHARLC